jgi:RNA-directed DNA polymerase
MTKPYSIDFRAPETANDLSSYLGLNEKIFNWVISSEDRRQFYSAEKILKRSRHRADQFRDIWNVKGSILAESHKIIARRFELFARLADPRYPHEAAYGYIRNRGTRENAKVHCGARLLLRADLRNFFPSISFERSPEAIASQRLL